MKQQGKWALALLAAVGFQAARGDQAAGSNAVASSSWYDNLKIKGDMRYRFDDVQQEGKASYERDRIRARIGLFPKINEDVDVGIRLGTDQPVGTSNGQGNPTSNNQTLTSEDSKKPIFLDLGYIDWHPSAMKGLDLIGGKMTNPLITEGTYLWDPDVTPEGLAVKYHVDLADTVELLVNGTYQWLNQSTTSDSTKLYAGQLALNFKPSSDSHITVGGTYYNFANIQGAGVLDWQNANNAYGNSTAKKISGTTTNLLYADEFKVVEGFAEAGFDVGLPVTFYGAYSKNNDPSSNNKAYIAGVKIGQLGAPNTFLVGYDYRQVEKDVFPGALPDDDAWGGGTDGKGHKLYASYQILKNWELDLTYWITQKSIASGESETDYKHLMVDLMARF